MKNGAVTHPSQSIKIWRQLLNRRFGFIKDKNNEEVKYERVSAFWKSMMLSFKLFEMTVFGLHWRFCTFHQLHLQTLSSSFYCSSCCLFFSYSSKQTVLSNPGLWNLELQKLDRILFSSNTELFDQNRNTLSSVKHERFAS